MARAGTMSVDELRAALDRREKVRVVDIRDAEDRAEWAIPGSVHVDAYDSLSRGSLGPLAALRAEAGERLVLVCYRGVMSMNAAMTLSAHGVPALSLEGGMSAWSLAWNVAEVPAQSGDVARIVQVRRTGKGCLSYVVGSDGEAAVIDPSLEPEVYAQLAQARGWRVTRVIETHVHADHLSRARALAAATGATLHLPRTNRVHYPYEPVDDGATLRVGRAEIRALRTPGHTPESTCYRVGNALVTGDTLFPSAVGRPDLEATPQGARERALALHASLARLFAEPPSTLVLACHTSEPVAFDGRLVAATLAEARERIPLARVDAESFARELLARLPAAPPNHHHIVKLNEAGADLPEEHVQMELEAGANRCAVP